MHVIGLAKTINGELMRLPSRIGFFYERLYDADKIIENDCYRSPVYSTSKGPDGRCSVRIVEYWCQGAN